METNEIVNEPSNSTLIARIRAEKVSPYVFPMLDFVLVRSVADKIMLIKMVLTKHHNVKWEHANSISRKGEHVRYRHHFMSLMLKHTSYSLEGIGRELKGKGKPMDHSSIGYGRDTWQNNVDQNYKGCRKINKLVNDELHQIFKVNSKED
jgi:hypothetical protein